MGKEPTGPQSGSPQPADEHASDASSGDQVADGRGPEAVEDVLAELGIEAADLGATDMQEVLKQLAPVQVEEDGARPTVTARPDRPSALPDSEVGPKAAHDRRLDRKFIAAERLERWVFRAVWWPLLFAVIYSLF